MRRNPVSFPEFMISSVSTEKSRALGEIRMFATHVQKPLLNLNATVERKRFGND